MKLPLHLNQKRAPRTPDEVRADAMLRLDALQAAQALRPDGGGFRKAPTSRKGSKSRAKQLSPRPSTRAERLAQIAYA